MKSCYRVGLLIGCFLVGPVAAESNQAVAGRASAPPTAQAPNPEYVPAPTRTSQSYVRQIPPTSIQLPVAAQKPRTGSTSRPSPATSKADSRRLRAQQQSRKLATSLSATKSQSKSPYSGPKYTPPAVKGPIPGDNASDPWIIGSLPYAEVWTTDGYTDDYDDCPADAGGSPDVVYKYYSDHNQFINIDLCGSTFDTKLYIAYSWDPSTYFACNDDFTGCGVQSRIEGLYLYSGDEILITIDGFDGAYGDYNISAYEVYGEDEFDPIVIPGMPYYVEYTTNYHADDYDEACPDSSTSADVVFVYTPIDYEQVTIDLCASSYDTKVFVYENSITPGSPFACNEDGVGCPNYQSKIECLQLTGGNTYYVIVDGWGNQNGDFILDMFTCAPPCWTGCAPEATLDLEVCPEPGSDTINGGCRDGGYFQLIEPGEIVCGSVYWDESDYDTDWYSRYFFEGDSVTWCVVANFPVITHLIDLTGGCGTEYDLSNNSGLSCDTIYVGARIPADGQYAFMVENDYTFGYWPCINAPQYQAQLFVEPACGWGGCPLGSIPEGEECVELAVIGQDTVNGGCYTNPPVFSEIPDNQYVCGSLWRTADNWDEDVYIRSLQAGESVTFGVQAEVPVTAYIYDIGGACEYSQIVDYASGAPCQILTLSGTASGPTDFAFVVFATDVGNLYSCNTDPGIQWNYTAVINRANTCPDLACSPGATIEPEACEITAFQGYNAGCNNDPPTYAFISYDETLCGTCWYGTAGGSLWRDTDWHDANVADGDSVVWCVTAEFELDVFIIDVSPDCDFGSNITVAYDSLAACDTIYLTTRKQPGQNLRFVVAPHFWDPWLWCEYGDWNWEATLTKVDESCACDCAADPNCDGNTNISDVSLAVNVAFRNDPAIPDPNGQCPWDRTDVNCSGETNITDVSKLVDVAFRNANPATVFCIPCP